MTSMKHLLHEIRHNPLLWLLVFVPVVFVAQALKPGAHTLHVGIFRDGVLVHHEAVTFDFPPTGAEGP